MCKNMLAAGAILAAGALANADLTASVEHVFTGNLPDSGTYVWSWDLVVHVTGDDAWTVAGGPWVGEPWITLEGGTFYQSAANDGNPPEPSLFPAFPDSEYTSFYTTHLGWPNTPDQGVEAYFAYGPADTPTALVADWLCFPDGNDYPGDFTIARFTVVPDNPGWVATIDMQLCSYEGGGTVIPFHRGVNACESGLCASPTAVDFGSVIVGDTSAPQTIWLWTNCDTFWYGRVDVYASLSGPGAEDFSCSPMEADMGEVDCETFDVTFSPSAHGTRSATLLFEGWSWDYTDPNHPEHVFEGSAAVQLTGYGVSCFGDLDADDDVDLSDLAILLAHYGMTEGATYEDGDLDADADVDLADLAALLAVYGTTCP